MRKSTSSDKKQSRSRQMKPLKVLAAGLAIAAVIKELRLPKEERTWHGVLVGFVPYDFRIPTVDKIKKTFWDPAGTIVVNRAFGIGWTINLGALVAKARALSSSN